MQTPLRGRVGTRPFAPATVVFVHDQRDGRWWLEMLDQPISTLTELAIWSDRRQSLRLDLSRPPTSGQTQEHEFGQGGGFFQVLDSDDATRTTSWNTANAWRLVIDRFDATIPVQPTARSVGTASGRLEVCYPTSGGIPTAHVAGSFDGALVLVIDAQ